MAELSDVERLECSEARRRLRDLADAYRMLDLPAPKKHDWAWRAERTLTDLVSPAASILRDDDRFVLPYPGYDYPDSMVQLAITAALRDYAAGRGWLVPLADTLMAAVPRFFDEKAGTFRRYLRGVDDSKDYDAVDSWYLYHPMLSLSRLALGGVDAARAMLMRSIDYGVRAARHFNYQWPVFYRIQDFGVITQQPDADRPGETDAGGIYAYVMM